MLCAYLEIGIKVRFCQKHTKIGKNVFINLDCTFLDLAGITIEENVLVAPKVSLLSEGHPLSPGDSQALVPGHVHIKRNAWIGANTIILPRVTVEKMPLSQPVRGFKRRSG